MNRFLQALIVLLVLAAVFFTGRYTSGWWTSPSTSTTTGDHKHEHEAAGEAADEKPLGWTCPMHPQIKVPDPGQCPICGMDLTPIKRGENLGPREYAMSQDSLKLAEIQTAPVTRKFLTMPVRMVGKVDFDETAVRTIAARVPGRIDRMYVDYTGVTVESGDHLVWLYSPELLTAQEELLEARKRLQATKKEASAFLRESNRRAYQSARDKLLLWGLNAEQLDALEKRGAAEDHMMITSPAAGVVIHKMLNEGDYTKEGSKIYRIADLDRLWLRLDAYEQDLPWIRFGQRVTIHAEALPGEAFEGWISFIDPVLDERTRSVKVRVNVENKDNKLKPGMFVRAVVHSRIAETGRVLANRLAGKWISPMHPEIVKDGPGKCDVCGMDLIPASKLGYTTPGDAQPPLTVPASAVLVTGTRAVVYVAVPGKKRPTFEGRVVILGPRAGADYIVRSGLHENEKVVVNGAFRIDSSMQILAKPSMLSMPSESKLFTGADTAEFRTSLAPLYEGYFAMHAALAGDDLQATHKGGEATMRALEAARAAGIPIPAAEIWTEQAGVLRPALRSIAEATTLADARKAFQDASRAILELERAFRHTGRRTHFEQFCPMAFGSKGGTWLQPTEKTENPYFGASMYNCGEVRERFEAIATTVKPLDRKATGPRPGHQHRPGKPVKKEPPKKEEPAKKSAPKKTPRKVPAKKDAPSTTRLAPVFDAYFEVQRALAADDPSGASKSLGRLAAAIPVGQQAGWSKSALAHAGEIQRTAQAAAKSTAIAQLRTQFAALSTAMTALRKAVDYRGASPIYRVHCSMAFDGKGGDWLQDEKAVRNPYYGAAMLRCGSIHETTPAKQAK